LVLKGALEEEHLVPLLVQLAEQLQKLANIEYTHLQQLAHLHLLQVLLET
jgi:ABC-type transporter Mla MlaB component